MVRTEFLPFSTPTIEDDEINEVVDSLRSGWITTGPKVKRFEEEFKAYVGAPFAVPLSSATAGEHLTLLALKIQPGDDIITGEGGMVCTPDEALAEEISLLKFHGMNREAWRRFSAQGNPSYDIMLPGFKYNMMDIQAAIGLHQLGKLDGFIAKRTEIAA